MTIDDIMQQLLNDTREDYIMKWENAHEIIYMETCYKEQSLLSFSFVFIHEGKLI